MHWRLVGRGQGFGSVQ
uniref:Uncharacterized protein n=1 Tax=Rhizophora mucronata TaxID=61149 RepID=A0A2P2QV11_RHIMU